MAIEPTYRNSQGGFRLPWLSIGLAGLIAALGLGFAGTPEALIFDATREDAGRWTGLLTSHVVHVDGTHLLWNLTPLMLFGACAEACRLPDRRRLAGGLLLACVLIDLWLVLVPGAPDRYCGLSGPLHAVFAMVLLALHRELASPLPLALLAAGILKVAAEWLFGTGFTPSLADSSWTGTPWAHGLGLLAGIAAWTIAESARRRVPHFA